MRESHDGERARGRLPPNGAAERGAAQEQEGGRGRERTVPPGECACEGEAWLRRGEGV